MKPIVPLELKLRIHMGERILDLGDNLVQARQALDSSALFDPLTKVLNRKAFFTLSYGELERARRGQSPLSLIALAIDNLKSVFDQFGRRHQLFDRLAAFLGQLGADAALVLETRDLVYSIGADGMIYFASERMFGLMTASRPTLNEKVMAFSEL